MAAFHKSNICWCNFQPNPYKEIRQKILNYCALKSKNALNLPKFQSSQDILLNKGPKVPRLSDNEIYEICCNSKKRNSSFRKEEDRVRIGNEYFSSEMEAQRNYAPENLKNRRNSAELGSQPMIPGQRIQPYAIAKKPWVSENPKILLTRPFLHLSLSDSTSIKYATPTLLTQRAKRREEHRKLKENVQARDSKKHDSIKQNRTNKWKGVDKYQHQSDLNKTSRRALQLEKTGDNHYRRAFEHQTVESAREMKKTNSISENSEQALLKQLSTERVSKSSLRRTSQLDTSLGIYRKVKLGINKRKGVDTFQQQSDLNETQNARRALRLKRTRDKHYRNALEPPKLEATGEKKKPKSFSENSEQVLFKQFSTEKVTKSNLRRTSNLDTSLGIYRKVKLGNETQMSSKPYSPMFGKINGELSKKFTTLRSTHELKVPEERPNKRTSDRSETSAPYSETFDKMLKGNSNKISEFHPILRSSNRLHLSSTMESKKVRKNRKSKTAIVGAKFSWASKNKVKGRLRTETKTFDELISDRDMKMPGRLPLLRSRTLLSSTISIKETKGLRKSKPSRNLEPSSGFRASETYRSYSKPFRTMLRGKERITPELNRALTSQFQIKHDGITTSSTWMDQDPIMSSPPFDEPEILQTSNKVLITKKPHDMRPSHEISIIKKPEIWQTFREHSGVRENEVSQDSVTVPLAPKLKKRISMSQLKNLYQSSTSSEFSLGFRSSKHRVSPGRKIRLKKFNYYIQNSMPDRKILAQMNSKCPISYLKSERSTFYGRTPSQTSSDRYQQSVGSIVRTTGIAQSLIPKQKKEEHEDDALDADEYLFESFPDDYDPVDGIKKTMNDIIASVANEERVTEKIAEKPYKKSQSKRGKHKAKTHYQAPGAFDDRQSILSLRRTSQEVKTRESQALRDVRMREQVRETFYANERASVQARIKKLMQEVAIREDFRPKRKPRDFVTENIVRLRNIQPTKESNALEKGKPQRKYPSLIRILAPHENPVNLSRVPKTPELNMSKPIRIRLYSDKIWRDQMATYQSGIKKPSPDAKVCRLSERKKCDCYLCKLLLKGKHQREPHFIKKAKVQRRRLELRSYYLELRKREREREICCP
ncbi:uncharacterized protein LOC120445379 [Drosophila santomea]|uniref:uncharacterized protein LOC120445379 n=1 Tax=Drosophila santomea TaxID=129105 RepID=UPI001954C7C1|nr:uncharacterized protein LOC120445379 [Drosophila santomea]